MPKKRLEFAEVDNLETLVREGDAKRLSQLLETWHPADITEAMRQLPVQLWPQVIEAVPDWQKRAQVVTELEKTDWPDFLSRLQPNVIAQLIKHMESDDAADVVGCLSEEQKHLVLCSLDTAERLSLLQLLGYPEDSAGGIMQLERAQVSHKATVADAIKTVRALVEEDVEVLVIWVVDEQQKLVGSCGLVDLLLHKSTTRIASIMDTNVTGVNPLMDQEQVAELFQKYDLLALPVLDSQGRVLGRIVIDDVVDVLSEEADEDVLHMAGTSTEELIHPTSVLSVVRVRLPWLFVGLLCSLASAFLLHAFEDTLKQASVLFAFTPVITAMSGNVANQSATLLIRRFATHRVRLQDVPRFFLREIKVVLVVGAILGAVCTAVAGLMLSESNWTFAAVVFLSLIAGMVSAVALGVCIPVFLRHLGVDPAVAAGPFVMTLSDIMGIAIYMAVAAPFFEKLLSP
ncbi:MAG: magnesium transporter [Myxococcota bacterium]